MWFAHIEARVDIILPWTLVLAYYDINDWLLHSNYAPQRIAQLLRVWNSGARIVDIVRKTFLKLQELPIGKPDRGIQACPDSTLAVTRPWYLQIESVVFYSKFAIKHIPYDKRGAIIHQRLDHFKYICVMDYSRYESSHKFHNMVGCELSFYKKFLPSDIYEQVEYLHKNLVANNPYCSFESRNGIRASGDGDTSLGNTYTNIMLADFVFHLCGIEWDGFFEGDDNVVGFDCADIDSFMEQFRIITRLLGYEVKLERRESILDSRFLSTYYGSEACWQDPESVLMRLNASFKVYYNPTLEKDLFNSKYLSAYLNNKDAPIIGPLCFKNLDHRRKYIIPDSGQTSTWYREKIDSQNEYLRTHKLTCNVSMQTRAEYAEVTGISPSEQIFCEQSFEKLRCIFGEGQELYECAPYFQVAGVDTIAIPNEIVRYSEVNKLRMHFPRFFEAADA
nr:RNA-dependent RNA polymerase [Tombusviridae sp.]